MGTERVVIGLAAVWAVILMVAFVAAMRVWPSSDVLRKYPLTVQLRVPGWRRKVQPADLGHLEAYLRRMSILTVLFWLYWVTTLGYLLFVSTYH